MGATSWARPRTAVLGLMKELGIFETFPTYNKGNNSYDCNGTACPTATAAARACRPTHRCRRGGEGHRLLDAMAKMGRSTRPTNRRTALEWDTQTVDTWKLDNVNTPSGLFLLDVACRLGLVVRAARRLAPVLPVLRRRPRATRASPAASTAL